MTSTKQKQQEFESIIKARYPKLFSRVVVLDADISIQLLNDLKNANTGYPTSQIKRMVNRFIASYTITPAYTLTMAKSFYKKEPRQGLEGEGSLILRGHMLEQITFTESNSDSLKGLESHRFMNFYQAVRTELLCEVS
ncbi:hypothetical protein AB4455_07840 [Vibrio sp. 10N.261.46.E12]|uniref:hypothetical protein n=1 Tax=unclassified Vibrio TaxID=2614977 RepID=UPI0009772897|nr:MULTISPECIES: hypothetical protein [unclassified Vibrio]OMO34453.1 hypothetical protein BH584_12560 [Vibrio sp. 10N.261.45.E1]PMJ26224.1 hypothetical protein BCU27_09725 [Vibrio sp. 10N.286.45.B6]PML82782.1 hypothetical protein BCT66_20040 [Vibrio sp. 10N.261.49.E11]PMM90306.1 hypothetical protein BCT46_23465 [Vibrio sp. 10N.261.46.E8]PMN43926.1 hypothetical protein BCT32_00745 [Vibrio sp. 10N.261.45.E11]